jgi:RNA polymerase sigma factor (sigma-70 family)
MASNFSTSVDVPARIVHYVRKSVADRARRTNFDADRQNDLTQEILARLWELEPDLDAWNRFSNKEFGTPAYHRFHNHLLVTVRRVLDRATRTPRVEASALDLGNATDTGRRRRYLEPDRPLTSLEAEALPGRDPTLLNLDLGIDLRNALDALSPQARAVVTRKMQGDTWDQIAAHLGLSVTEVRRLFAHSISRLTARLKSYGELLD